MGKATGLKRVKGKCNVFRLQQDLHAWNVDGSSTDQLQNTSWIKYWEEKSGLSRGRCAFSDCDRGAEHGGHVWIKGHASQTRGVWIAPVCKQCNYCENLKRQRDARGQHSFVRKGTVVVRTKYTPDMANAERRVSYPDDGEEYDSDDYDEDDWEEQICEACGFDLPFGTPKHHTKCPDCFRSGGPTGFCSHFINRQQVTETEYRTQEAARRVRWGSHDALYESQLGGTQSFSRPHSLLGTSAKRLQGRDCEVCGDDISDRPANCYSARRNSVGGTVKRDRGRRCEGCGGDISDRPANHSVCLGCYSARRNSVGGTVKRARGRRCEGCGGDISTTSHTRCYTCYKG